MDNFKIMLDKHKEWIDSAGESGEQISLDCVDMHSLTIKAPLLEQGFFSECDFSGLSFDTVDFYQSEFYSCSFTGAQFSHCDFRKATLDYSDFTGAVFSNCKFSRADAFKVKFDNCVFTNCSFVGFNLMEASIIAARIETTDFDSAYFDKVNALNAQLINPMNAEKANQINIYIENITDIIEGTAAIKKLEPQN